MSNSEPFTTIETSNLAHVTGGGRAEGSVSVELPVRGRATVSGSVQNTDYEACIAAARRTANESYPDTRNPWQQITGAPDLNARRRADYEREGIRACAPPAHSN